MLAIRTALSLAYEHLAQCIEEEDESDGDDPDPGIAAAELNAWFAQSGGSGAVEVRASDDNRCGLFATAPIGAGDAYVRVPRKFLLDRASALAAAPALARGELRAAAVGCDADSVVALTVCARLALERAAGGASFFAPYVRALPKRFAGHPLRDASGDACLAGCYALEALREARRNCARFIAAARACYDVDVPRCRWAWAYRCWMTRCIFVKGLGADGAPAWAFVPVVDMTNCRWAPGAPRSRATFERGAAAMRTPSKVGAGAEVGENYGWTNFDYFIAHGFVLPPPFADDAVVARPTRLAAADGSRAALLEAVLGPPAFGWPRTFHWQPVLPAAVAAARIRAAPAPAPETTWARGHNASTVIAVALELEPVSAALAVAAVGSGEPVEAAVAAAAAPPALARAWRRLAAIADADASDLRRAAANDSHGTGAAAEAARAFRGAALRLSESVGAAYRAEAAALDGVAPPPYA